MTTLTLELNKDFFNNHFNKANDVELKEFMYDKLRTPISIEDYLFTQEVVGEKVFLSLVLNISGC